MITFVGGCPECKVRREANNAKRDRFRGSARERGYTSKWDAASKAFLSKEENSCCVYCLEKTPPKITTATVTDHYIPHKGNMTLFWDKTNWRPSCKQCHDRKTVLEDGGFGRRVKEKDASKAQVDQPPKAEWYLR